MGNPQPLKCPIFFNKRNSPLSIERKERNCANVVVVLPNHQIHQNIRYKISKIIFERNKKTLIDAKEQDTKAMFQD